MEPEFELWDTGVLREDRFFDITIEYAKADRGRHADPRHGHQPRTGGGAAPPPADALVSQYLELGRDKTRPNLRVGSDHSDALGVIEASHDVLGEYRLGVRRSGTASLHRKRNQPAVAFRRAEPVAAREGRLSRGGREGKCRGGQSGPDGNESGGALPVRRLGPVESRRDSAAPAAESTRGAARAPRALSGDLRARFEISTGSSSSAARKRIEFYRALAPKCLSEEHCAIQRQALAGMLWTKQFYYYVVEQWLEGDPPSRLRLTNVRAVATRTWRHLYNERVMSMPDTWEFPWYAAWDLAFHCIPLALVDPHFAKAQLDIILREWYQHPNGQIPAYEWNFGDVNPPVIGWAAWRVYKIEQHATGKGDRAFLETVFHKLLINFTWWVNRKDSGGRNIFEGGFPRPRQHRRLRPEHAVPRRQPARAERRHELDGNVLPDDDANRARAGAREPGLRKHRDQVLRALPRDRRAR